MVRANCDCISGIAVFRINRSAGTSSFTLLIGISLLDEITASLLGNASCLYTPTLKCSLWNGLWLHRSCQLKVVSIGVSQGRDPAASHFIGRSDNSYAVDSLYPL